MTFSLCAKCGKDALVETSVSYVVQHCDKTKTIDDVRMRCSACENLSYQGDQISRHERAVAAAIREMDGLLSPEDLFRIRSKYKFKQTEMEQILSTGPKTWTRWERGKVPHSKSADKLIRVMAENPDVTRRLMEQAGVHNPDAVAVFEQIDRDTKRIASASLKASVGTIELSSAGKIGASDTDKFFDRFYESALESIRVARAQVLRSEAA